MVLRRVSLRIKYAFSAAKLTPSTPPPCSPLQKRPEIVTTGRILLERQRAMCPRLGDAYARTERAATVNWRVRGASRRACGALLPNARPAARPGIQPRWNEAAERPRARAPLETADG